jgi:hypothetical protein
MASLGSRDSQAVLEGLGATPLKLLANSSATGGQQRTV